MTQTPATLWGHFSAKVARLEMAVGLLSLGVLILASILGWQAYQGLPVYFVLPGGPGVAQPGVIPEAFATDYATRCLQARYTFTPSTLKAAHAAFLPCLHPTLLVEFDARAKKEVTMVKEVQMSSQLTVLDATVSRRLGASLVVELRWVRTVWIGGQQVRDEPAQGIMLVTPWPEQHPRGLLVRALPVMPDLNIRGE
jgi:hypothetical protein